MSQVSKLMTVAIVGLGLIASLPDANAASFQTVYSFMDPPDGDIPTGLIAVNGDIYGTTFAGGSYDGSNGGDGTVFRLTLAGQETVLHSFGGSGDGMNPWDGLLKAGAAFYGTTDSGGAATEGTVFKMLPDGTTTVLHSFGPLPAGAFSWSTPTKRGSFFYGTTSSGGIHGAGTVFKMTNAGKFITLHSFNGKTDGYYPYGNLVDIGGTLYGTAYAGGKAVCSIGCGTVFKITPDDAVSLVYTFPDSPDGANPNPGLIAVNGVLYGTTFSGGSQGRNNGIVFKLTTTGIETTLYSFGSSIGDALHPTAGLLYAQGNFYGTADGGQNGKGTVFKVTPDGTETVLYSFTGQGDGGGPATSLIQLNGSFYGTTSYGGSGACHVQCGTVFKVTP